MKKKRQSADDIAKHWAPRVDPQSIRRLYKSDAKGLVDEDLINDVGFALYARCETIRIVTERRCPECEGEMPFGGKTIGAKRNESLTCPDCGWTTTWACYHKSYKGRRIFGGRAYSAFLLFAKEFKAKRSPRQRMLAIDRLVHSVHEDANGGAAGPGAVNLLDGKMHEILEILDDLANGDTGVAATSTVRREYLSKMDEGRLVREKHRQAVRKRKANK